MLNLVSHIQISYGEATCLGSDDLLDRVIGIAGAAADRTFTVLNVSPIV